jgi:hypothetical protein
MHGFAWWMDGIRINIVSIVDKKSNGMNGKLVALYDHSVPSGHFISYYKYQYKELYLVVFAKNCERGQCIRSNIIHIRCEDLTISPCIR